MNYHFEEEAGRIIAKDNEGKEAGEVTFTREGDNILIIDHTGVNEAHRGQGLASQLISEVVEKARKDDFKIMPVCPFAKQQFEEKADYNEILHQ